MKHYKTIFLDQDGVLARFTQGVISQVNPFFGTNVTYADIIKNDDFRLETNWGISVSEWWNVIDLNPTFWLDIPPFEWCNKLHEECSKYADEVVILTAPSRNPNCIPQKIKWLDKHMGIDMEYIVPSRKKYLLSRKNTLLIDDSMKNVNEFLTGEGDAVCVPSDWNTEGLTFERVWNTIYAKINS